MLVIDTREPMEYDMGHVEGAINISPMRFMAGGGPGGRGKKPKKEKKNL